MGEDTSLENFLDDDREAEPPGAVDGADASEATDDQQGRDAPAVEPASATHAWTPGGRPCDSCDDVVERRWRDEAGLVCERCKDW